MICMYYSPQVYNRRFNRATWQSKGCEKLVSWWVYVKHHSGPLEALPLWMVSTWFLFKHPSAELTCIITRCTPQFFIICPAAITMTTQPCWVMTTAADGEWKLLTYVFFLLLPHSGHSSPCFLSLLIRWKTKALRHVWRDLAGYKNKSTLYDRERPTCLLRKKATFLSE